MNKDCYKADKFDLSVAGKFNQKNRRLKSKARRKENKVEILSLDTAYVQCDKCGKYVYVGMNQCWGYCPFCENDQVEIKK